jgi:NADPH:quinone reductase-like Zn-dependent oxidoreductase
MKAVVYRSYGKPELVLRVEDIPRPTVEPHDVLVRVRASSVNLDDLQYVRGEIFIRPGAWRRPKHPILGSDIAGTVEAVGPRVHRIRAGDDVIADLTKFGFGGFAEYATVPARALARKPAALSFEEAACVPTAGLRAYQGLTSTRPLRPGHHVLVNGAGGGLGTFAIQIAKALGATVTGVDAASKFDVMRAAGADHVLDYRQSHYSDSGGRFDLILDIAAYSSTGDLRPVLRSERVLTPDGRYVMYMAGGGAADWVLTQILLQGWMKLRGGRKLSIRRGTPNRRADLARVTDMIESGTVRPIIDRRCSLHEIAEALLYVERGEAKGKVVIAIDEGTRASSRGARPGRA